MDFKHLLVVLLVTESVFSRETSKSTRIRLRRKPLPQAHYQLPILIPQHVFNPDFVPILPHQRLRIAVPYHQTQSQTMDTESSQHFDLSPQEARLPHIVALQGPSPALLRSSIFDLTQNKSDFLLQRETGFNIPQIQVPSTNKTDIIRQGKELLHESVHKNSETNNKEIEKTMVVPSVQTQTTETIHSESNERRKDNSTSNKNEAKIQILFHPNIQIKIPENTKIRQPNQNVEMQSQISKKLASMPIESELLRESDEVLNRYFLRARERNSNNVTIKAKFAKENTSTAQFPHTLASRLILNDSKTEDLKVNTKIKNGSLSPENDTNFINEPLLIHLQQSEDEPKQEYKQKPTHKASPYKSGYTIKDLVTGTDFGHEESSDGEQIRGSYYVDLPDGRTQRVNYYADDETGFVADVTYVDKNNNNSEYKENR